MTDNKQPEALRLAEQYDYGDPAAHSNTWKVAVCTELRRQHARIAELEAQLEAVGAGGVQALSAAPAVPNGDELRRIARSARTSASDDASPTEYVLAGWKAAMLAASPTPPAEQQATKETSGGFHVWRDISTAPKDGSRFVATGHNYGLYSEVRHACVAQWFRGCWIEASDWNETSELKYLTHWMPLPSPPDDVAAPAEQQAAPKAAPQQEAQEPAAYVHVPHYTIEGKVRPVVSFEKHQQDYADGIYSTRIPLFTAHQPAPAPLSDDVVQKTWALIDELEKLRGADRYDEDWDTLNKRDDELRAALAAQGGK